MTFLHAVSMGHDAVSTGEELIVPFGQSLTVIGLGKKRWSIKVKNGPGTTLDIRVLSGSKDYGRIQGLIVEGVARIELDNKYSWSTNKVVSIQLCEDSDVLPVPFEERSEAFVRIIEGFHTSKNQSTAESAVGKLPLEKRARQETLVTIYSGNVHYGPVNRCLRDDDEATMTKYAGFIYELREVFRVGDVEPVAKPFSGHVRRGISHATPMLYLLNLRVGQELVWPAFTSTSTGTSFTGNVYFEIACMMVAGRKPEYAPMKISHLSWYPFEEEVIFPPHMRFRVVNIKGNMVQLETVEFPSVWELIEKQDWAGFKKWADANPTRVDTKESEHSLINKVAEHWLQNLDSATAMLADANPLQVCVKHHADINEEDKTTGATPLIVAAKAYQAIDDDCALQQKVQQVLTWCLAVGGNAQKAGMAGKAVDICPSIVEFQKSVEPKGFKWMYHVDDNIDGKAKGWYPYEAKAWPKVEEHFGKWRQGVPDKVVVRSRSDALTAFDYEIDFNAMRQTNKSTGKTREIRREAFV